MRNRLIIRRFTCVSLTRAESNGHGIGAGHGLLIASRVAEAHGGIIKLERSDSSGSSFVV